MTDRFARVRERQRPSASRDNAVAGTVERLSDARAANQQRGAFYQDSIEVYITDVSSTELVAIAGATAPAGGELELDVRLPPELIEADRDGVDYTYTDVNNREGDDGSETEDQVMHPSYAAGDVIVVRQDEEDGVLVDTNRAGRAWAVIE